MVPTDMLESLKGYMEALLSDTILPTVVSKDSGERPERPPFVYLMNTPTQEDRLGKVPYVVLQYLQGEQIQKAGQRPIATAKIRFILVFYNENQEEGKLQLLNVVSKIQTALLQDGVVAKRYLLESPIEHFIYPEDEFYYYGGEIMTNWRIPATEREVNYD